MMFRRFLMVLAILAAGTVLAESLYVGPACSTKDTTCSQAAASTANVPTSTTPGIKLENACGVRIVLVARLEDGGVADNAQHFDGGTLRLHYKSDLVGAYGRNQEVSITVPQNASDRVMVFADRETPVAYGRMYVEARSVPVILSDAGVGRVGVAVETIGCRSTR